MLSYIPALAHIPMPCQPSEHTLMACSCSPATVACRLPGPPLACCCSPALTESSFPCPPAYCRHGTFRVNPSHPSPAACPNQATPAAARRAQPPAPRALRYVTMEPNAHYEGNRRRERPVPESRLSQSRKPPAWAGSCVIEAPPAGPRSKAAMLVSSKGGLSKTPGRRPQAGLLAPCLQHAVARAA